MEQYQYAIGLLELFHPYSDRVQHFDTIMERHSHHIRVVSSYWLEISFYISLLDIYK